MVSFEMFLNSNCSTDSTNFWKKIWPLQWLFSASAMFLLYFVDRFHMMWIHGLWLCVLNMNSFIYANWSGSDLRRKLNYTDGFDLNLFLCFAIEMAHEMLDSGYCHLHVYIGFYGVNKFSDCSPFVEFSSKSLTFRHIGLCGKATHNWQMFMNHLFTFVRADSSVWVIIFCLQEQRQTF